jgi:hypothetical protein
MKNSKSKKNRLTIYRTLYGQKRDFLLIFEPGHTSFYEIIDRESFKLEKLEALIGRCDEKKQCFTI